MTCNRSYCVAFVYCIVTQICLVYGQEFNKSSLTFVIDDSGSMTDEIEQVKSSVDSIFETVMMSKTSQIQNFVLVTFNDPDYILHVVTEEQDVFRAAASKVHVRDGIPQCPEKAMTGIKVAIENSLPLSTLYVFTDASAKDSEMYEEVKNMAQKKQIQVTFMLTGDCGSREHRRYKVYNQLARATNGEVFNLMKSDITDILEYVKENTKSRSDIIAFKKFPPGYGNKLEYSVDSKMNDLIISVTGLKPKIEVTDSEGNKVDIKHILNKDEIAIMKATDLKPGVYVADVGSTSETYVKVMAKTSVNFYYGFSPFETSSLSDTATRPAPDGESYLSIKLQGEGVKLESVKIFDMDGNILEELPLRLNNEKERFYVTKSFHPPDVAFQLSVFGYVEENKSIIKRTSSTPIERQSEIVGSAVNVAPSVTITEGPKLFVDYRSPLQVKCKVHGHPKPDITWQEKDSGVIIPSNVLVIEAPYDFMSILHIEKPHKNSTYECKAQNALGTINSSIQVETNVYFNVLETPPGTVEIEYGKEGNIRCIIDASPPASISWHNNGSLLSNDTDIVISHDMQTVTIKHATLESQGIFICELKNEYNTKSFSSKVSVIGLENPVIDKPDEKIRAVEGADAQLACRILRGTPKPTIQWRFQQQIVKSFKEIEGTNETLLLKNISVDDEGTYMCNASNIMGSQSYTMDLIVEYPAIIKYDGIKMMQTLDGDEITLLCSVAGVPTPTVKWLRNGTTLQSSKKILTTIDHSLQIRTIDISDTGQYTCEATNHLGSSNKSIYVYVYEKPEIDKPDEKINVVKGANAQLTCRILRGTPKPTMQWNFQHKKKNLKELEENNEALLLRNVSVDDEGRYTCNASNIVGSQHYTIDVTVEYLPTIKEDGIKMIETKDGAEVILPCNVDGLPTPTVRWLRNGTILHNSKNILTTSDFSLKIRRIDVSDAGSYTCEAENHLGSTNKSIDVLVFDKPVIKKPVEKIYAVKGADVRLTCRTLRGTPKPSIKWHFQHKTKNLKEIEEINEDLLLKNVSVDDEGKYTCNASNIVGSQSYTIAVIVEYPPSIKEDGIKIIETKDGDEVILPCNVDGSPTPTVRWLRNGTILHNSKNIFTTSDSSLKITTIGVSDTGSYTCEAENPLGSSKKSVEVNVFDKPVIKKPVQKIYAVKGADVRLTCRTLRGTPKPSIQWHFQHKTKNLTEIEEINEDLLLKNVSVDDEGKYTCNASNIVGSQSYTIDVIVEYPPSIKEDGIKIIETKDGDEVILPCNVDGSPTPTVRWLRNGTILHNSKNILTTSDFSLKITAIGVSDTGSYTCEAENPLGSSKKSVEVNVFDKPVIKKPVEKIYAVKGADVRLTCRTLRGTPKPSIKWHFQHKTKNLKEIEEINEDLLLKNVSVDDEGKYTCNASNIVGSQSYTIAVIVEYPPSIKEDGIKIIETKDGDEVILLCNVDGSPTPTVRWLRNGTILHNSKNILTTSDFSLKITAIGVSDTGSYTCEAENPLGSSKKSVEVNVFDKPVIKKPVEKIYAVKGADVRLTCRTLRGTPKPSIKWHFQHKTKNLKEIEEINEDLLLKNVSVDDEGKYTCNASNIVGSQSYTIAVIVEYPPSIKEDGIKIIETKDGDEVILLCNVDGSPTPTVRWLRNGTILHNSKNILTTSDFSLKITAIGVSDTGSYTCEAENPLGSSKKSVEVNVFDKPVIKKPVEKIYAVKGADVRLTCRTLRGTPKPSIKWHFQHKTKNLKEIEEINEDLLLKNVSVDDEGKYTCNASNIVGSQSYTIAVIVEYPPSIKEDGIKIIETKDGDEVILPCNVDGSPTPTVRWLRNGTILHNSKNILTTSDFSLKITTIGVSDTGSYTCEAENPLGSSKKSVEVNVFDKPVIKKPVQKIFAVKGADVRLTCRTLRGTPKPSIQWHFQHKTKNLKEIEEINEDLLLKNVSVDDEGKYTCNASNIVGSQSYTIDVIVEYPPSIKEDGIKIIETKDGDEVILPCNVDGSPTPTVRWLRNGTIFHNSKNILTTSDFSLKITAIGVSDTGSYTCEAENPLGSSKKSVEVNVFDKPVIKKPVEKIYAVKGADVRLTCRTLRGTPKPSIKWHFQHKTKNLKEIEEINEDLLLKNVSVDDEGKYMCNASNVVGSQSYTIAVIVEYPPSIKEDGIKIIETIDSDDVILPCNVDGSPTPTVRWLRNGTILHNSKNILTTSDFSLKITAISVSDTGSYTCEAENPLGSSKKSVEVNVFDKPVIEKPVEKIRGLMGADVELTCRILRGTPTPTIQWHFLNPKAKKFRNLGETNEALLLKNVNVHDEGTYTCNASNVVGSQSYSIDVTVEYPPTIKEDGIKMVQTLNGNDVTLPCNVDGVPTPTVKWVRNGTTVHTTKDIFTSSDHSLKIRTIKLSDTGLYTCEAENYLDSSSKSIFVNVFEKPVIDKPYGETRAPKGSDVKLTCRIVRGTPEPTMQWYFQQQKAKKFREIKDDNEVLLIKNVGVDDEGTYKCNASNIVGSQSYTMDLVVEYPPTIKDDGIKMIKALNGDAVTLPCSVDGVPTPTVKWVRNGMTLHTSKDIVITSHHSLKIRTTKLSDAGLYICLAENYLDSSSKSTIVYVFEKPVIDKPYRETRALKGSDVKLTCRIVRGTPAPTMQWYFQQRKAKKFREIKDDNEALLIKNVSVDDEGTYKCNASNIVGSQSYTMDLVMECPPTIKDDGFKMIKALNGDAVTLPCSVDGVPTPTVKWVRNGITLHASKDIVITSDHSLKIITTKLSDAGLYTCVAENYLDSSSKSIKVYVFEKPVIDKPYEETRALKGTDVKLTCRIVRGTPAPTMQWYFQQRKAKKFKEIKDDNEALLIKKVSVDDEGTYKCNASNIAGSQSYTMDLVLEYPPTVKDDGIKMIKALNGDAVTLPCSVDGVPTPTVKWVRNGITLHTSKDIVITSDHSLKFRAIKVSDSGYYTCKAENRFGPSKKTILVYVFEKPIIVKPAEKIRAVEGGHVQLICRISRGTPKPTIQWHFRSRKAKKFRELKKNKETLPFKDVRVANAGTYMCNASNIVGSQHYIMDLTVEYPPTVKDNGIKRINAKDGDDVNLPCNVDGVPTPTVKWLNGDTTLHRSKKFLTTSDNSLKITTIHVSETGYYTCQAKNHLGTSKKTVFVFVFVPPSIEKPKASTINLMVGRDLTLPCHTDGYPEPEVKWLFKEFDTKATPRRLRSNDKTKGFSLPRVQLRDQGNYTCEASNIGGTTNITYIVNVYAPPIIQNLYAVKTFTCVKGDLGLRIQCKAEGYPKPSIVWKKDNINIVSGTKWFDIEEGALIIKNIEKSQQGTYTCLATNGIGYDSSVYTVMVNDYPIVPKIKSPMVIGPGTSLDVPCNIKHKITDSIRWYKDSRLIAYGKLTLKNISYLDSGIYSCRVGDMWKSSSSHVEIKIGYKPSFYKKETETIQFKKGRFYPLSCLAKGQPAPKVTWTYNGKTLSVSSMIYTIEMTLKNRGNYTCEIINSLGSIERSFRIISQDCILEIKKDFLHKNQPMMLTPHMEWPIFPIDDGFMLIEKGEPLYLHCPANFVKFPMNFIRAFCDGETQIQIYGNKYEYSEIECTEEIKPDLNKRTNRCLFGNGVIVEVGYKIYGNFLNAYNVCLDTISNVPLYTQHILTPDQYNVSTNKNVWWPTYLSPYHFDTIYNCKTQTYDISSILERPFHYNDECCFGKRQLVSPMDFKPGIPASTAYTYLNVVPHWSTCNSKNWAELEQKVRDLAKLLNTDLTVLTGTVEPLQMKGRRGYRKITIHDDLGKKLSVAQYLWKVVQDPASASSLAIIQVNAPDLSPKDIPILTRCRDICEDIEWMKGTNWRNVEDGYTYCCSILEFETAFNYKGAFSRGKTGVLNMRSDAPAYPDYSDYSDY